MTRRFLLLLASSFALSACGTREKGARDSVAVDSARPAVAPDTVPSPRVVPYNPAAPGAMRSGDTPIKPPPAPPRASSPAPVDSIGDPVAVVRDYYAAIRAHDFLKAYRMWESSGQRNVRSLSQFAAGFDSTKSVDAKVGAPGRVEGAAGSRFVTVPVEIDSRLRNGARQEFSGTYTLRRVVVPGAPAAERRWHLYASNIRQVP